MFDIYTALINELELEAARRRGEHLADSLDAAISAGHIDPKTATKEELIAFTFKCLDSDAT